MGYPKTGYGARASGALWGRLWTIGGTGGVAPCLCLRGGRCDGLCPVGATCCGHGGPATLPSLPSSGEYSVSRPEDNEGRRAFAESLVRSPRGAGAQRPTTTPPWGCRVPNPNPCQKIDSSARLVHHRARPAPTKRASIACDSSWSCLDNVVRRGDP